VVSEMTLDEFAIRMEGAAGRLRLELEAMLVVYGDIVVKYAKDMIGHEHPEWPALTEATIAAKARAGYPVPAPLLLTGKMRDSIVAEVAGMTLFVGSPDKIAVFHELGTSRMPPRPFLEPAMKHTIPEAGKLIGEAVKVSMANVGAVGTFVPTTMKW
jgi:HK97 gp10 family phage protein